MALRPPSDSLVRHCPEYATHRAPCTKTSSGRSVSRAIRRISFSDSFRTNIGLANLGNRPALFTIALQRVTGRNIAVTQITVPQGTLWHTSIQALFPLITKGEDFSLLIETGSRETYVYASVIENATNEAHFIEPMIAPTVRSASTSQ